MQNRLAELARCFPPSGALARDVDRLLAAHGREQTREHVPRVTAKARELAARFGVEVERAETAALLHDIGGIFERSEMVGLALGLGLPVRPEERQVPLLLHARLGEVLAHDLYGVTDPGILQAIRFHTTLHAAPAPLDEVVFLADKLEWDQGGVPPYHAELTAALEGGLRAGVRWMLGWMATLEARLLIPHPDLRAAWKAYGVEEQGC